MTPTVEKKRREFHRQFSGNEENAINSVKAHMINCIKASAPLMSASEKAAVKKAAKLLFDCELMGEKRAREITRWAEKR